MLASLSCSFSSSPLLRVISNFRSLTVHNVGQLVSIYLRLSFIPSHLQFLGHSPSTMLASLSRSFSSSPLLRVISSFRSLSCTWARWAASSLWLLHTASSRSSSWIRALSLLCSAPWLATSRWKSSDWRFSDSRSTWRMTSLEAGVQGQKWKNGSSTARQAWSQGSKTRNCFHAFHSKTRLFSVSCS